MNFNYTLNDEILSFECRPKPIATVLYQSCAMVDCTRRETADSFNSTRYVNAFLTTVFKFFQVFQCRASNNNDSRDFATL